MKFIFPQNYNFNTKLFGVIDYKTAILNIIIGSFLYLILNLIVTDIIIKMIIFIIIYFPIFLLSIFGFNQENIFYVLSYLLKFIKSKKLYLYNK